jgi:hypothetical protein
MILLNFCKGREFLSFFVEVMTKFDLGEARPDLSGLFENLRVTIGNGRRIKAPTFRLRSM